MTFLVSASELQLHHQGQMHQLEVHFCFLADLILDSEANLLSPQAAVCLLLTEMAGLHGFRERRIGPDPHLLFDRKCTASKTDHGHSYVPVAVRFILTWSLLVAG